MVETDTPSPPWQVSEWLNTSQPVTLAGLRGKVIVLHAVFEHHDVMGPKALRAFLSECRIRFPVGIDQAANDSSIPLTMRAYGLQGTPSVVVFDGEGRVRFSRLGQIKDLHLGAVIGELLAATQWGATSDTLSCSDGLSSASCDVEECVAGVHR